MILKVFSLFDSKSKSYGNPFFMNSAGAAVRAFSDLINGVDSLPAKHPGDFVLYEIGSFDDGSAVLTSIVPHIHLGVGLAFVEKKPVVFNPASSDGVKSA